MHPQQREPGSKMDEFDRALAEFLAGGSRFLDLEAALARTLAANPAAGPTAFAAITHAHRAGHLSLQHYVQLKNRIAGTQGTDPSRPQPPDPGPPDDRTIMRAGPATGTRPSQPATSPLAGGASTGGFAPTGPMTGSQTGARSDPRSIPTQTGGSTSGSSTWGTGSSVWPTNEDAADATKVVEPGAVLRDRFVLERIVGRGGMGVVFRARDLRKEEAQDRDPYVAIKVLNDEFRHHPQSLKALQRESRKAQNLAHPNIATVFDFDRDGTTVYMQMEFLEGSSLDKITKRDNFYGFPPRKALPLIQGLGSALAYAHGKGIVHSDFKPGNCFLTRDGVIKVFDFGIARAAKIPGRAQGDMTTFDPGTLGALTPTYASCEMIEGADPDPRDDIYALGCVAYEILTGRHPFNKKSAVEARDAGLVPAPVRGLSRRQQQALQKALAFKREDRTPSVQEFLTEFDSIAPSNVRFVAAAAGVVVVAAIAGFFAYQYLTGPSSDTELNQLVADAVAALDAGDNDAARRLIESARAEAPDDARLQALEERLAAVLADSGSGGSTEADDGAGTDTDDDAAANALLGQLTAALETAAGDYPAAEREFRGLLVNLGDALPADDARLGAARSDVGAWLVASAAEMRGQGQLNVARYLLERASEFTAGIDASRLGIDRELAAIGAEEARLAAENQTANDGPLDTDEGDADEADAEEAEAARLAARIDELRTQFNAAAAANDVDRAGAALATLRGLAPAGDQFVSVTAPAALANAYVRLAQAELDAGRFDAAERFVEDARARSLTNGALTSLLQEARAARLGANVTALGELIDTGSPADLARSQALLRAIESDAGSTFAPRQAELIGRAERRLAGAANADSLSGWYSTLFGVPVGPPDPTCRIAQAGLGQTALGECWDSLGGGEGPRLVVVPAAGDIPALAFGKYEVSAGDWNRYCSASGECSPRAEAAGLPLTRVTREEVRSYIEWLQEETGAPYRLPTRAEWRHAAGEPSATADAHCGRQPSPRPVTNGAANAFGLVNAFGNAQELVAAYPHDYARMRVAGGGYQDGNDDCSTTEITRAMPDGRDDQTGFRLVRELADGG